jgi:Nif-specific regulatory protein
VQRARGDVAVVDADHERLRLERDLYLGLLDLSDREDPGAFLEEALRLIVRVFGVEQGYLEVSDPQDGPTWWRAAGCSDKQVDTIRNLVSRGIIAEALAQGDVISCPSAILDPVFGKLRSVQAARIEAVLCVPIVQRTPVGVLYLQGRLGGGSFSDPEIDRARTCTRHLAPLFESLFIRSRHGPADHVAPFKKRLSLDGVVGTSAALAEVLREVELVAPLNIAVLISGETGTGKTQLARVIHENSPRRGRPFVEVNCAAIQDNLFESQLFGALPGSFTNATRRIEGWVAAAHGGTLFLDEVAELSSTVQSKLLQFLHTGEYYPLGSSTPHKADVRIIAATNDNLREAVDERRFRSDLFFRLQGLSIRMPSLSERKEDLAPLTAYLCERAARSHGHAVLAPSPGALRAIEAADWPGNVRELTAALESAAMRAAADGSKAIEATHVFRQASSPAGLAPRSQLTFQEETRRLQSTIVLRALEAEDWNVAAAARGLDLTRAHLYNLIKGFGLKRRPKST